MPFSKTRLTSYILILLLLIFSISAKISKAGDTTIPGPTYPSYDQQAVLSYSQNQGPTISVIVTAITQPEDSHQSGQNYLLNGLSDAGYWYQWGLTKDWTPGYDNGNFYLVYSLFTPSGSYEGAGTVLFHGGQVNEGDKVLLTMSITSNDNVSEVLMTANDLNTGANATWWFYNTHGATQFIGNPEKISDQNGYFTGLMSEQYFQTPFPSLLDTQVETYYQTSDIAQPAWMQLDQIYCTGDNQCGYTSPDTYFSVTGDPTIPSPDYPYATKNFLDYTGIVEAYLPGGTFQTGLSSALFLRLSNNVLNGEPETITGWQSGQYSEVMTLELTGPNNYFEYLGGNPGGVDYTLCDGEGSVCPTTPGTYTANFISQSFGYYSGGSIAEQDYTIISFRVEPPGITAQQCPNNDQIGNGYAPGQGSPSTGVEPDCNTCPNGAVNPNGQGFAGVPNSGCNVFCPDSQINYAGGPGNDLPCSLCPDGTITTGKCPSFFPSDGGTDISGSGCSPPGDPTIMYVGDYMQQCPSSSQCPNFAYDAPQCNACPGGTSVSGAQDMCPENPINCVLDDGTGSACQQCNFEYVISSGQQCPGNGSPPNYHNLSGGGCGIVQQGPNSTAGHNVNSLIWIVSSSGSLGFGCGIVQQGNLTNANIIISNNGLGKGTNTTTLSSNILRKIFGKKTKYTTTVKNN
jgi:hypothetical protein